MTADGSKRDAPGEIDFDVVRARLAETESRIGNAWMPDAEETRRILKARAAVLAKLPPTHNGETLEVVELVLASETYAIETAFVREIRPLSALTPVPCTPAFVLGIINLRGEILSVIDIGRFFDLPARGLTDLNKVVVLGSDEMTFAILADAVAGVRRLAVDEIQRSLPTLTGIREKYLTGVTPDRKVVLDGRKLIHDGDIVVREQVQSGGESR